MLRTRLLSAAAAVSLLAAGTAFAQTAPIPHGSAQTTTGQTVMPSAAPDSSPPRAGGQSDSPAPISASGTTGAQGEVSGAATPAASGTVVDVLRSHGQFATLLSALDAAQLTETLTSQSAISIFAPTDAAFAALPESERTRLLDPANVNELRQVLLYHVIVADVSSTQIEGALGGVETAASVQVQLDGTGDTIKVDKATVTTADIDASNGTVFIIDRVLNPETSLVASGDAEETSIPLPADSATPGAATPDTTAPKPQS